MATKTPNNLGRFEQLVMLSVWTLGENAYGTTILKEVETAQQKEAAIGAIYATLDRLQEKGYVSSAKGEPTPERGGRAKKFFTITASGEHTLQHSLHGIRRLAPQLALVGDMP